MGYSKHTRQQAYLLHQQSKSNLNFLTVELFYRKLGFTAQGFLEQLQYYPVCDGKIAIELAGNNAIDIIESLDFRNRPMYEWTLEYQSKVHWVLEYQEEWGICYDGYYEQFTNLPATAITLTHHHIDLKNYSVVQGEPKLKVYQQYLNFIYL